MLEQMQAFGIDPWMIVAIILAVPSAIIMVEKFMISAKNIKNMTVDSKANKIIDAALEGDESLREEIQRQFDHAASEHEEFREMLDRDNKRLNRLEREMDAQRLRSDGHEGRLDRHDRIMDGLAEESRILLSSVKTLLNKHIGLAVDTDIVDTVKEIDNFLIERKDL